ncbi:MAG: zinc ABC transporter substrate-binding protein [Methanoregula sp.]|nr:zinc ABC transporter substrate-binding protein [Methanoregula sp.]
MQEQKITVLQGNRNHEGKYGHSRIIMILCMVAGAMILLMAAGCVQQQGAVVPADNGTAPLKVAVTILPQKQFVERIAGDYARVIVLVPPGADPHTHEPTPKQLEDISRASVYVKVGSGIEFERAWMDKLSGVNPRMTVVDSSTGIQLIYGHHEHDEADAVPGTHKNTSEEGAGSDPHIWLSPKNAKVMVENTYQGLALADPLHKAEYRANTDSYLRDLDKLDADISHEISQKQIHTIMVYHPAWSYFARDYGLLQIPIETDGKDPTPKGLENLIRQAKAGNITVIFASPEYSTKSADVIAKEIGGSVALVSPLEEDYLGNIRKVSSAFIRGVSTR